jgi:hypothetical protein
MVVSYSFLWKREQEKAETSGGKDKPAAIVIIRSDLGPGERVYVVPITHFGPAQGDQTKIAIPQVVKQRLGWTRNDPGSTSANITLSFGRARTSDPRELRAARRANKPAFTVSYRGSSFAKIRLALNEYRLSNKPRLTRR